MSDRATTWAWQQQPKSDKAWLALILLANVADDEGRVTLRRKDFAAMLRCSVDTFDRRVSSLCEEEMLKVEKSFSRRGQRPNGYVLAIPEDFARISRGRSSAAPDSRKNAAAAPETIQETSGAAELRLAATAAAPIKNTNQYNPEREEYISLDEPKKKTRFNPKWRRVSDNLRAYASEKGFVNGSVDEMFEAFRDHHMSRGSMFVDWFAAWRTWVNKAVKFQQEREQKHEQQRRNDPNQNRRNRHRVLADVLEARKLGSELLDGQSGRAIAVRSNL